MATNVKLGEPTGASRFCGFKLHVTVVPEAEEAANKKAMLKKAARIFSKWRRLKIVVLMNFLISRGKKKKKFFNWAESAGSEPVANGRIIPQTGCALNGVLPVWSGVLRLLPQIAGPRPRVGKFAAQLVQETVLAASASWIRKDGKGARYGRVPLKRRFERPRVVAPAYPLPSRNNCSAPCSNPWQSG